MTASSEDTPVARRGPNTPAGKAVARMNAVRHGLRAITLAIPGVESEEDWTEFLRDVEVALAPAGAVEFALAARVAELLWRIRRVPRAEHGMITAEQERQAAIVMRETAARHASGEDASHSDTAGPLSFYAAALTPAPPRPRLMPRDGELQQIVRYEAHLNRQLYHALHELEALQARRSGDRTPLARVDVFDSSQE